MNLIGLQLLTVDQVFNGLRIGVADVLESRPGEAVFPAQPPSAPDALPSQDARQASMTENERRRREDAARRFWDALAVSTEHQDVTKVQAFREMCEAAIKVYDGTEDQRVADWARARRCAS